MREVGDIVGGYEVISVSGPDKLGRIIVILSDSIALKPLEPGSAEADIVVNKIARQLKPNSSKTKPGLGNETTDSQ